MVEQNARLFLNTGVLIEEIGSGDVLYKVVQEIRAAGKDSRIGKIKMQPIGTCGGCSCVWKDYVGLFNLDRTTLQTCVNLIENCNKYLKRISNLRTRMGTPL